LSLVETVLSSPDNNAVVLFGQRRIGKTSILLQLQRRLPSPPFLPVYFDLMDRAHRPLGAVLAELAATIAVSAGMPTPIIENFDNLGVYFQQTFLPTLYTRLSEEQRPLLLFDEFDVLDVGTEQQLPDTAAAKTFFPYLRQLMGREPRLAFVFVLGRKTEDMSTDALATFKAARYKQVFVLDDPDARELIRTAERQNSLRFRDDAVERIMALTSGHPYFTQLLCQLLWDETQRNATKDLPTVTAREVDAMIAKTLEAGQNIFEWIWDGLPPAERVIFAAVADGSDERQVISKQQISDILQQRGIRILTRELDLAPAKLVEWGMLRETAGGYGFFIEIMRRWVATTKPLARVKDELDRIIPLADTLFRSGEGFYQQRNLESAIGLLRQALTVNPNHLKARLLLGQVLLEQQDLEQAVRELEEAYRYDEDATRYPLVRTLLIYGEELERTQHDDQAETAYRRVLEMSPQENVAHQRLKTLLVNRGDRALAEGDFATTLQAYRSAGVDELERITLLTDMSDKSGDGLYFQQNLENATGLLRQALTLDPAYTKARLLLGQVLLHQQKLEQAVHELEEAYRYDKATTSNVYVHTLLVYGESLERMQRNTEAEAVYRRVLEVSPAENVAQQHLKTILNNRGDRALVAGDFDTALQAYHAAQMPEKEAEVEAAKRRYELEQSAEDIQQLEQNEQWKEATKRYERLLELDPKNERWRKALKRVEFEQSLQRQYARSLEALEQERPEQAIQILAGVIHMRLDYKDTAKLLLDTLQQVSKQDEDIVYPKQAQIADGLITQLSVLSIGVIVSLSIAIVESWQVTSVVVIVLVTAMIASLVITIYLYISTRISPVSPAASSVPGLTTKPT